MAKILVYAILFYYYFMVSEASIRPNFYSDIYSYTSRSWFKNGYNNFLGITFITVTLPVILVNVICLLEYRSNVDFGIFNNAFENKMFLFAGIMSTICYHLSCHYNEFIKMKKFKNISCSNIVFHLQLAYVEEFLFRTFGLFVLNFMPPFCSVLFLGILFNIIHANLDKSYAIG